MPKLVKSTKKCHEGKHRSKMSKRRCVKSGPGRKVKSVRKHRSARKH